MGKVKYRFSFPREFFRKNYALFAGGAVRRMEGFCYTETYISVTAQTFRTDWGSTLAVQGIFYDAAKQPLDYWGVAHNQSGGIVTAPASTAYIRANWDAEKLGTAYLGTIDGTDNWLGSHPCYPIYKDDLAIDYEHESGQKFFRKKWDGKLTFLGKDYDAIVTGGINRQWHLLAEVSEDNGRTWSELHKSAFYLTDCTVNMDNRTIEVQPDTFDDYTGILAGMDKEFNLIELLPEFCPVEIAKRPLIQLYVPGDSVISCFLGGTNWEQDADAVTSEKALRKTYKFGLCNILKEMLITGSGTPADTGLYTGRMAQGSTPAEFEGSLYSDSRDYYVFVKQGLVRDEETWKLLGDVIVEYRRTSDNAALFRYERLGSKQPFDTETFTLSPVEGAGSAGSLECDMASYNVYGRYLVDVDSIGGVKASDLPSDDITDNTRHYRKAFAYAHDVCFISYNFSDNPTEWGLAENGKFFAPPSDIGKYYPIAQNAWRYASLWFAFEKNDWALETQGRKRYLLRDAYTFSSCVNAVLNKIAPDIVHDAKEVYSEFLYAPKNPINGAENARLLLSPKSNITYGEYQTPAQKAPVTFSMLMQMLANTYKCYWFVEDGKLRIEQAEWFHRGGSYTERRAVGTDLTVLLNKRNGKPYDYAKNSYSYTKETMPARYEFAWMDDVTSLFGGSPINILSPFVDEGKKEDVTISNTTTDIDYMMLNPTEISEDGFAMLAAHEAEAITDYLDYPIPGYGIETGGNDGDTAPRINIDTLAGGKEAVLTVVATGGGTATVCWYDTAGEKLSAAAATFAADGAEHDVSVTIPANAAQMGFTAAGLVQATVKLLTVNNMWQLPFTRLHYAGTDFYAQNGELALPYLQPWCWIYDMPASALEINGEYTGAGSVERKKRQTVKYPCGTSPDTVRLVKTSVGAGVIEKISVTLGSLNGTANLLHDTEL